MDPDPRQNLRSRPCWRCGTEYHPHPTCTCPDEPDEPDPEPDELQEDEPGFDIPTCHFCGCTDDAPCEGGCWWVADAGLRDVCCRCDDALADLEQQIGATLDIYADGPDTELAEALSEFGLDAAAAGCGRISVASPSGELIFWRVLDIDGGELASALRWTAPGAPAALSASERGGLVSTLGELALGELALTAPPQAAEVRP